MESVKVYEKPDDIQIQVRSVRFKAGSDLSSSVNLMAVDVTDNSDADNQDITVMIRISSQVPK
jgi:hypothetical protein